MARKPRLSVHKENKTGLNTHFRDNVTGEVLTRGVVADNIDKYGDYHVMKKDGKRVIRSNPDKTKNNNLY